MFEQLGGLGTVINVLNQTLGNEVAAFSRPLMWLLEVWDTLRGNQEKSLIERESVESKHRRHSTREELNHYSERRELHIWGFSFCHFHSHDTQTPNINLGSVIVSSNQFGSHPVGCLMLTSSQNVNNKSDCIVKTNYLLPRQCFSFVAFV